MMGVPSSSPSALRLSSAAHALTNLASFRYPGAPVAIVIKFRSSTLLPAERRVPVPRSSKDVVSPHRVGLADRATDCLWYVCFILSNVRRDSRDLPSRVISAGYKNEFVGDSSIPALECARVFLTLREL